MMRPLKIWAFLLLGACLACSGEITHHGKANVHMHGVPFEKLLERFEAPERATWQKPEEVVAQLGDLNGKVVADIGCGSGYFSFRLQSAGARVICIDVDDRFLKFVEEKRTAVALTDSAIETRLVPYDSPGLTRNEVDVVLLVNTYHHIEGRRAYFAKVKEGLKKGGSLVIIDYKAKPTRVGPPQHIRIAARQVTEELKEAGFGGFAINRSLLPHQYIVVAQLQ